MNISFTVEGMKDLINSFEKVERGVLDLRQLGAWKGVQSTFYRIQREIFAAEGPGWKPLSSPYKEIKAAKWGDKPILQASGGMYKEFTSDAGNVDMSAQEMSFKFSSPAGYHMTKGSHSKMPYRSSLDLTEAHQQQLFEPIKVKLKQLIDGAKLRDIRGF